MSCRSVTRRTASSPLAARPRAIHRCVLASLVLTTTAVLASDDALDPTETDADKYRTILENEEVRVLEYRDEPGDRTAQHHHPRFVLYALSAFEREVTLPDGKVLQRKFVPGDVMWSDAQTHIGHNVGQSDTHVILIELKADPAPALSAKVAASGTDR